jgi:hypothetical protein
MNSATVLRRALLSVIPKRHFAMAASETDQALRESISNYSRLVIQPKVSQMDQEGKMDSEIVKSLFDHVR